jgi:hypothetical protein
MFSSTVARLDQSREEWRPCSALATPRVHSAMTAAAGEGARGAAAAGCLATAGCGTLLPRTEAAHPACCLLPGGRCFLPLATCPCCPPPPPPPLSRHRLADASPRPAPPRPAAQVSCMSWAGAAGCPTAWPLWRPTARRGAPGRRCQTCASGARRWRPAAWRGTCTRWAGRAGGGWVGGQGGRAAAWGAPLRTCLPPFWIAASRAAASGPLHTQTPLLTDAAPPPRCSPRPR